MYSSWFISLFVDVQYITIECEQNACTREQENGSSHILIFTTKEACEIKMNLFQLFVWIVVVYQSRFLKFLRWAKKAVKQ